MKNQLTSAYAHHVYSDTGKTFTHWRKQWASVWDSDKAAKSCESLKRRKAKYEYYLQFPMSSGGQHDQR